MIAGTWSNAFHVYGLLRQANSASAYWDGQLVVSYPTDDNGGGQSLVLNVGNRYGTGVYGTAELTASLRAGTYQPGEVRRVWIPKAGGGQRGLGIPNVIDRVVQEAVRLVLEPIYEPTFHTSSHGFRPKRSCHTAIAEAKGYLEEGYAYVVDLDLKDFFNRVNHQRLMARLAQRVDDKQLLGLIGKMLRVKVVMPHGVVASTEEGVPQGGPLSPLLSNIVLDELDWMLDERGHRFVRYADDSNIYVRSERAGQRVMASVTDFIERRMRLEVNRAKSAVAKPEERHFLGFSLRPGPLEGDVDVLLSKRSKERVDARIRELTPRNWGRSLHAMVLELNAYFLGWLGHFGICTVGQEKGFHTLDAHIRRRPRAVLLKQWKKRRFIVRKLIGLGVKRKVAWNNVYEGHRSLWALSHVPAVHQGLRPAYFAAQGLLSIRERWKLTARHSDVPRQLTLDVALLRGRDGGDNPSSRRAGCEQHLSGSVRGAPGDRGAYSVRSCQGQATDRAIGCFSLNGGTDRASSGG